MIRSLLYVPASSERFVAKAHERDADAVVLDLEDAVAPADKTAARASLAEAVPSVGRNGARVFVRVNNRADLLAEDTAAAVRAGADGVVLPKTESPNDLADLAMVLERAEADGRPPTPVIALIESPGAVLDARAIARGPRLLGLMGGGEDLALAMDAQPTPDVLRIPKLLVHYAAKAQGLLSFGLLRSVADYADHDAIRAAAAEARAFGFDGATCVHPAVVPLLNEAFSPSPEELDWARRVVEAAKMEQGAFVVDGRMVDAPVIERARRLLERARVSSPPP
jgi:citrate lyase subunit beta/citryl-CoA lyase